MANLFPDNQTNSRPLLSSADSGMMVFSSSARILHMNRPARILMASFDSSYDLWAQMAPESLPFILTELCYDVLAQLQRRLETQDWAQFEIRRICHIVRPSLLLTGFGVRNSTNNEVRVILTLTPLPSVPAAAVDPQLHYQSAGIEASVVGAFS